MKNRTVISLAVATALVLLMSGAYADYDHRGAAASTKTNHLTKPVSVKTAANSSPTSSSLGMLLMCLVAAR